jgi:hypothetical protein
MKTFHPTETLVPTDAKHLESAEPQEASSQEVVALDPLLLAADFKGVFSGAPVGIDEDCNDCD